MSATAKITTVNKSTVATEGRWIGSYQEQETVTFGLEAKTAVHLSSKGDKFYVARQVTGKDGVGYHTCDCQGSDWMWKQGLRGGGDWFKKFHKEGKPYNACKHVKSEIARGNFQTPKRMETRMVTKLWETSNPEAIVERKVGNVTKLFANPKFTGGREFQVAFVPANVELKPDMVEKLVKMFA